MPKSLSLSNAIIDDRGARHTLRRLSLADQTSFRLRGSSFRVISPETTATNTERAVFIGRRSLRDAEPASRVLAVILVLAAAAFALCGVLVLVLTSAAPMVAGGLLVVGLVMGYAFYQDRRRAAADLLLLASLPPACLACCYDLSGLSPDSDGFTTCPECAAVWRLTGTRSRRAR